MSLTLPTLIFFVGLLVGWAIRLGYGRQSKRNVVTLERRSRLELALVVLAVIALHALPLLYAFTPRLRFADYRLPAGAVPLGTALFVAALGVFWRSHADLGRNWSPAPRIHAQQSLITGGIYRRIRHPMYAAHWLAALAQALLLQNWLAGPVFLALFVPIYLLRVAREERMMLDHFGPQYRDYMSRTRQIIPGVW